MEDGGISGSWGARGEGVWDVGKGDRAFFPGSRRWCTLGSEVTATRSNQVMLVSWRLTGSSEVAGWKMICQRNNDMRWASWNVDAVDLIWTWEVDRKRVSLRCLEGWASGPDRQTYHPSTLVGLICTINKSVACTAGTPLVFWIKQSDRLKISITFAVCLTRFRPTPELKKIEGSTCLRFNVG